MIPRPLLALLLALSCVLFAFVAVLWSTGETTPAEVSTPEAEQVAPSETESPRSVAGVGSERAALRVEAASAEAASSSEGTWTGRVVDRAGDPVQARVLLCDLAGTVCWAEAESEAFGPSAGAFALQPAEDPVGPLLLLATAPDQGIALRELSSLPRSTNDLGLLRFEGGASLAGQARDRHGNPLVGLELYATLERRLRPASDPLAPALGRLPKEPQRLALALRADGARTQGRTRVRADGTFRFDGLVEGVYRLEIAGRNWGSGFRGSYQTGSFAQIEDGAAVGFALQVLDEAGRPIRAARAVLRGLPPETRSLKEFDLEAEDARGGCSAMPGPYLLLVEAPGALPALETLELTAAPHAVHTVFLRFPDPAVVTVEAHPGATVLAQRRLPAPYDVPSFLRARSVTQRVTVPAPEIDPGVDPELDSEVDALRTDGPGSRAAVVLRLPPGPWRLWQEHDERGAGDALEFEFRAGERRRLGLPDPPALDPARAEEPVFHQRASRADPRR